MTTQIVETIYTYSVMGACKTVLNIVASQPARHLQVAYHGRVLDVSLSQPETGVHVWENGHGSTVADLYLEGDWKGALVIDAPFEIFAAALA